MQWGNDLDMSADDIAQVISRFDGTETMSGELPSADSQHDDDKARLLVRKIFELEGIESEKEALRQSDLFDEIFKKSAQTLVYRGYSDDPRNTDEAWVETSAWHVHCPSYLAADLGDSYKQSSRQVQWLNIVMKGQRIELFGVDGHKYDMFASHRELIELAVYGNVHGLRGQQTCRHHLCVQARK